MTTEKDPVKKARKDFIEKVTVVGWKDAFDEPIAWIRHTFQMALIICSVVCIYYIYILVGLKYWYQRSGFTTQVSQVINLGPLAVSNVSICAQVYFNQTFVQQNLTIPKEIKEKLKNEMDEFYRQLTLFLTPMLRVRVLNPEYMAVFGKVMEVNPQIKDFFSPKSMAWPSCQVMFKSCSFDGQPFDCCERVVQSLDDDGVCYLIALNFDSDNAFPSDGTFHQSRLGPSGGLSVEVSLALEDFPWLEEDAQYGYRVIVDPVPFGVVSKPVAVPASAETFVKVKPKKYTLTRNCSAHNTLSMVGGQFMYYDPLGYSCGAKRFEEMSQKIFAHCDFPIFLYRPNSSTVCGPFELYLSTWMMTAEKIENQYVNSREVKLLENELKSVFSEKSACPWHCQTWVYSSTASFVSLQQRQSDVPEGSFMYSLIHMYYADWDYELEEEVTEEIAYLALYAFGNVADLYWGISIVSGPCLLLCPEILVCLVAKS